MKLAFFIEYRAEIGGWGWVEVREGDGEFRGFEGETNREQDAKQCLVEDDEPAVVLLEQKWPSES